MPEGFSFALKTKMARTSRPLRPSRRRTMSQPVHGRLFLFSLPSDQPQPLLRTRAKSRQPWPTRQPTASGTNVGQTWRNGGQSLGRLQQPEFCRPVHQGPAQSLNVPSLSVARRTAISASRRVLPRRLWGSCPIRSCGTRSTHLAQ